MGAVLIGYARVSTGDQDLALQLDALRAAGCERCFSDTASGSLSERPQLTRALEELRDGQDMLVVWRLDRLGRSLPDLIELIGRLEQRQLGFRSLSEGIDTTTSSGRLVFHIFGAIAEFERQLIRERTQAGLAAARARGRRGGRRAVITEDKLRVARELVAGGERTMQEIADMIGVGRATLYRHLDVRRPGTATSATSVASPRAPAAAAGEAGSSRGSLPASPPERPRRGAASRRSARPVSGRRWQGLVAERALWLEDVCPTCRAGAGARCRDPWGRAGRASSDELHFARGWRQRTCPTCHAQPGEGCVTPRGRPAARPHTARLARASGELIRSEAWEELERTGANLAVVTFTGSRRTGVRFGPIRLQRLTNGELAEIETSSESRSGDPLIEALKAPVADRFGGFLGQPPVRATLSWVLEERHVVIAGTRGSQPFEGISG